MARGNRLLGTLRGKLGDTVYYRSRGYQIERPRVVPKNPRSRAQMEQRVKIANVSAIYRALQPVLSESFAVRGPHESSFNAFSRAAMQQSPFMTKTQVSQCLALPMPVQLSRGGLGTYNYTEYTDGANVVYAVLKSYDTDGTLPTVGLWSQKFLEENPQFRNGDTITMCLIKFVENDALGEFAYNAIGFKHSFTIDTTGMVDILSVGFAFDADRHILVPNGWPTVDSVNAAGSNIMSGILVSRKDENGAVDVSSQYFVLNEGAELLYKARRTPQALQQAIDSYGIGRESVLVE